tara:strand:+ start:860 stop:1510 length:651 start_codon:yes stop_codon:yes gene_type:complete
MILGLLQNDPQVGFILILTLIFSLSFHEFSHAYIAYRLGDNTAAYKGRLTLNPIAHLDLVGSLMLLFVGFGYAKPVPINPVNLSNPRQDMIKIAFAGPASNLLLVFFSCFLMRIVGLNNLIDYGTLNSWGLVLYLFAMINMTLAIFNLIPIHPLDGGQIFGNYLDRINPEFSYKLRMYGPQILMFIIFFGIFTGFSIIGLIIEPFHELVRIMIGFQ